MNERDFVHLRDHSPAHIDALVSRALELKRRPQIGTPLAGRKLSLVFLNPSLRTRMSFEFAGKELGAHVAVVSPGSDAWKIEHRPGAIMNGDAAEHLSEALGVISRYSDAIGLRAFPSGSSWQEDRTDPLLSAARNHARVPLVNLESATGHPCQALADWMTLREHLDTRGRTFLLTWAPHVKALPTAVPHSAVEMAAMAGMNVRIAHPEGYDLDAEVMARVRRHCEANGTRCEVTDDVDSAYEGVHAVYAKSWGRLDRYQEAPSPALHPQWMVTRERMARTQRAVFMHCLPVRRNIVVEDAVLDGDSSVVLDQAENRLHTAKALLLHMLNPSPESSEEH